MACHRSHSLNLLQYGPEKMTVIFRVGRDMRTKQFYNNALMAPESLCKVSDPQNLLLCHCLFLLGSGDCGTDLGSLAGYSVTSRL